MNLFGYRGNALIKLWITVQLLVFSTSSMVLAQQINLSVGSGTAIPGASVTVPIILNVSGGAQPAGLQWTMGYSSADISSVSVTAGSSSTAAGKTLSCSSTSTATICVAYGVNENIIASGTVASATITIASGSLDSSAPIQISGVVATDMTGSTAIPASGTSGTITIPQQTQPTLSGFSCAPATVNAGGVSACTVTLSSAALAGGFVVGVTSNNANATVASSVTVAAGSASVGFPATASTTVPSAQTAVLTASAAGVSKTFSLNLLAATWTISGSVGTAGSGATIALTGASTATTTANGSGAYTFTGLVNGSYTITPNLSGHTFSPASVAVTVSGANVTAATMTATSQTWTILGSVGTAGSGATIALTGVSTATTIANASGVYTFTGLANGSYTITPSLSGFTFSPASVAVTVNGANVTAATMTATSSQTWTISGSVGTGGSGATIALTGASTATTTANASGAYTFPGLANGSYTITPSLSGHSFSPASVAVTVSGANVTAATMTATSQTWTISGSVGTAGSSATLALTGASTATTTANGAGAYTFTGLANGSYTITPSLSGYTFSPASVAVTVNGASVTAATMTATSSQTWTISGSVGTAGSGATLALTGASTATTTANASGAYTFTGLVNGSYTVTPSLGAYAFSPTSLAVTVNGANVTASNFTATPVSGAPVFIQEKDHQITSGKIASETFSSPTTAGNLLVVYVVWDNSGAVSVSDTAGNSYASALAPLRWGTNSAQIFYVPNSNGGAGKVTATFTKAIRSFGIIYIHEYSGVALTAPIDVTGAASGLTTAMSSGLATTTSPNDLIFGAGANSDAVTAVGSGFTVRSQAEHNVTEDQVASSPGAYAATATGNGYDWAMQMVAFKAASTITGQAMPAAVPTTAKASNRSNGVDSGASLVLATITTGQAGAACSSGGLASLLGAGLTAAPTEKSSSVPLPTQLAGVQVMVNGAPAPLLFASSSQINFQCPVLPQGMAMEIQVEAAGGAITSSLQTVMQAAAPLVFQMDASGRGVVTIAGTNEIAMSTTDGVPSRPVLRGEHLTIHATGLGEVVDGVAAGTAAPLNRQIITKAKISVMLGGIEVDSQFAGLAPGTVGVYQVNAQVPAGATAGTAIPLYLKVTLPDGTIVQSNTVTVAIGDGTK